MAKAFSWPCAFITMACQASRLADPEISLPEKLF